MSDIVLIEGENELNVAMTLVYVPPPTAEFVISNLSVSPLSGLVGKEATLNFTVTNIGGERGDWWVPLKLSLNGMEYITIGIGGTLNPGQSETWVSPFVPPEVGIWTIRANEYTVTYVAI